MKLKMSSNLFSVLQPDMYGTFEPLMESLEEGETEWYYDDENRYGIKETGQEGHYECNSYKMCEIISKEWINSFNQRLNERGIKAKAEYATINRPREYNFMTDAVVFNLSISKREIDRLFNACRVRKDEFNTYLKKYHSSRSGFISFMANNYEDWDINTRQVQFVQNEMLYGKDWERSIWQALDFLMWDDEPYDNLNYIHNNIRTDREDWSDDLRWYIEDDMVGNGAFSDCLEFVPDEVMEAA